MNTYQIDIHSLFYNGSCFECSLTNTTETLYNNSLFLSQVIARERPTIFNDIIQNLPIQSTRVTSVNSYMPDKYFKSVLHGWMVGAWDPKSTISPETLRYYIGGPIIRKWWDRIGLVRPDLPINLHDARLKIKVIIQGLLGTETNVHYVVNALFRSFLRGKYGRKTHPNIGTIWISSKDSWPWLDASSNPMETTTRH